MKSEENDRSELTTLSVDKQMLKSINKHKVEREYPNVRELLAEELEFLQESE